jgi:hypothetical protein
MVEVAAHAHCVVHQFSWVVPPCSPPRVDSYSSTMITVDSARLPFYAFPIYAVILSLWILLSYQASTSVPYRKLLNDYELWITAIAYIKAFARKDHRKPWPTSMNKIVTSQIWSNLMSYNCKSLEDDKEPCRYYRFSAGYDRKERYCYMHIHC